MYNPFSFSEELLAEMSARMTPEERVTEASRVANLFFALTGAPLAGGPNQMRTFREAGVDCSHLLEVSEIPSA